MATVPGGTVGPFAGDPDERGDLLTDPAEEGRALRALIDHLPAMIAYWDREQRNVLANAAYIEWFGKRPEQMRGMHIRDLLGPDLYAQNRPYIEGALGGATQQFDRTLVDASGKTRYSQAAYIPDIGPDGCVRGFFVQVTDVTERTRERHELNAALSFREAVLSTSPDIISVYDLDLAQTVWASRSLPEVLGYDIAHLQEMQALGLETLLDPESAKQFVTSMRAVRDVADGEVVEGVANVRHADGSWRVIARRSTPFRRSADGRVTQVLNTTHDQTTEVKQAAELRHAHAFQQAVIATVPELILVLDVRTWRPTWTSRPLADLIGWSDEDLEAMGDHPLETITHSDDVGELRKALHTASETPDGELTHARCRLRTVQRRWRWLQMAMTPFERTSDGSVTSLLAVVRDVTDIVEAEEQLAHAALHDPLTGLPNRRLIGDRLEVALAGLNRGGAVGVLFIDLDGFKRINDAYGHAAGDAVLSATADRLSHAVRPADTVGRMGGDEFVVIIAALPIGEAHKIGTELADRIRRDVAHPVHWGGQDHTVTASIGIVLADVGSNIQTVLRDADNAMYLAKERGKDTIAFYDPSLRAEAVQRAATEQAIRNALTSDSIEVFFQPILRLADRSVAGVEALLRIRDEQGDYIDAQHVVEVAEATGLIIDIGAVVLLSAARYATTWPGLPHVAVNLSAREIGRPDLYGRVRRSIDAVGLAPARLALELTETVLLDAAQSTLHDLEHLRDDGISINIDDFGTGYASLRYLTTLPITGIKIDRSFTAGLGIDHVSDSVVAACLSLTSELNIDCVVEGVETSQQMAMLSAQPNVFVQGFLLGRPEPPREPSAA